MPSNTPFSKPVAADERPDAWGPRVAAVLEAQRRICIELEALTGRQRECIVQGDTNTLMSVLGERQDLINQLTALNVEIEPYRADWERYMQRVTPAQREAMQAAVAELGQLVDRISASDDADRKHLEEQRSVVSAEMTTLSRSRVAVSAYGAQPSARPIYQDRRC